MRGFPPSIAKIATALLILTILIGCGGGTTSSPSPTPTTIPELTASQILAKASAKLALTRTIQFKLTISGETFVDTNDQIQLLEASGRLIRPDKVYTQFRVKLVKAMTISMELITIGEKHWSTDLITGKWGPAPEEFGYNPSILFDNQNGIGPVMDRISDAQKLANASVQGRDCYHIVAKVNQALIAPLTSKSMQGDNVSVDLWIDTNDFNLLQIQLSESKDVTGHQPATWLLSLTEQDKPMTISPPDAPFSVSSPVASPVGSPGATPIGSPEATPVASPLASPGAAA